MLELLRIDNSRPAHSFRLVAFPNEFRKERVRQSEGRSERGEVYRAFFQELIDQLREEHRFTRARKGQAQSWYTFASGHAGIGYSSSFAQGGRARAEIYIHGGSPEHAKALFDHFSTLRDKIESSFGETLEWERLDNRRASRIAAYRLGSIDDDSQSLQEIREWMIDNLLKFREVFGSLLPEALSTVG